MVWRIAQWKEGWFVLVGKPTTEEGGDRHCWLGSRICRIGKGGGTEESSGSKE